MKSYTNQVHFKPKKSFDKATYVIDDKTQFSHNMYQLHHGKLGNCL